MPASRRSTFRKNCETEPSWTATLLPLRSRTDLISLRATMPSPPAESSSARTYWNSLPVLRWGIIVSIVETTPSSRPAPIARKLSFGSSIFTSWTSTFSASKYPFC